MELRDQLAIIRSWALVIIVAAVLAGAAAYFVSQTIPKSYEAHAKVRVSQTQSANPNVDSIQTAQNLSNTYAAIAKTDDFRLKVIARAGIANLSVKQFGDKVAVTADKDLPFIDIVVTDGVPANTVVIAQAMLDELDAASKSLSGGSATPDPFLTRQLQTIQARIEATVAQVDALEKAPGTPSPADQTRLTALLNDLAALRQTYSTFRSFIPLPANQLTVIEHPVPPVDPSSPRPTLNTAIAAILGLLIATGVAFVWERFDDRVKTPEDVEKVTGLPTIGTVLRMPSERGRKEFYRLATLLHPRSVAAESFRSIRTNLEFASVDKALRSITVTSSVPGEGKSVVSANIAVAFGQAGRRTVLVDADLRRPGGHSLFSVPNDRGLTDMVLSDSVSLADVAQQTEEPNLRIVTSGAVPANPAELLGSHRMAVILQRILADADLVILDTPPVGVVTDAALVAARTDATLLVISPDRSSERVVRMARESLAKVNARVVGAVLNNVSPRDADPNPYYGLYRPAEDARKTKSSKGSAPPPRPDSVVGLGGSPRSDAAPTIGRSDERLS